jgi:tRNA threonylcarbamoyladenosine biosynthesis protein TsaB
MRLLALDTATEACSVALLTERGLISDTVEIGRGHAQEILGMVDRILAEGGTTLASLSGIAAGIGPGSFTGVRVSVAVAQGLAFGAGLPVVPVTSLEALAIEAIDVGAQRVLACLDARMGEVYWACFAAEVSGMLSAVGPSMVGPPTAVALPSGGASSAARQYRGVGRGFAAYPALCALPGLIVESGASSALPQARAIARLGAARLAAGAGIDAEFLEPLYLRDKVAMTEAERGARRGVDK